MNPRPLRDRVIVKRLNNEVRTALGIVIPDAAVEKPDQDEVLAVGPGKRDDKGNAIALDIRVGGHMLFDKYTGQGVKVDGQEALAMRGEDVMAVVQK